jgi:hypothetical protein
MFLTAGALRSRFKSKAVMSAGNSSLLGRSKLLAAAGTSAAGIKVLKLGEVLLL